MITNQQIQLRLIEAITQSGMTQKEIAARLGIHPSNISHYKHGRFLPNLETFANLCEVIDVDPAYILWGHK